MRKKVTRPIISKHKEYNYFYLYHYISERTNHKNYATPSVPLINIHVGSGTEVKKMCNLMKKSKKSG